MANSSGESQPATIAHADFSRVARRCVRLGAVQIVFARARGGGSVAIDSSGLSVSSGVRDGRCRRERQRNDESSHAEVGGG